MGDVRDADPRLWLDTRLAWDSTSEHDLALSGRKLPAGLDVLGDLVGWTCGFPEEPWTSRELEPTSLA